MGQYYLVVNVDKKQQMLPFDYDNGMKLMEWSYDRNWMVLAMMNLLAGEWKGDRVYVVGDYADLDDPEEPCHQALKKVLDELGTEDLHSYADENFMRVLPDREVDTSWLTGEYSKPTEIRGCTEDLGYRYIYNHATRQFIDISKRPIEWTWYNEQEDKAYVTKIAPLPLLLAMGNGRGGGDYHKRHPGYDLVGSWCDTVTSIEVTKEPLALATDYDEFDPGFTENDPVIPYTSELKEIEKCEEEVRAQHGKV